MVNKHIYVYGADWCSDTRRVKEVLERANAPYEFFDTDVNEESKDFVMKVNEFMLGVAKVKIPVVRVGDGKNAILLIEPTAEDMEIAISESCRI